MLANYSAIKIQNISVLNEPIFSDRAIVASGIIATFIFPLQLSGCYSVDIALKV